MPAKKRPRRGSMQFWPRKRARRVYPSVNWKACSDEKPRLLGFAAYKAGMAHVVAIANNRASAKAATVLETPPIFVCGARFYSGSAALGELWAEKLPKGLERKIMKKKYSKQFDAEKNSAIISDARLIACTQPEKSGMHKIKPELFEIGLGGSVLEKISHCKSSIGKEILAKDIFRPGEYCDVTAITKGRGFTGAVKRFGIRIQGRKDEQHHRHPGSVGSTTPRKIDWRVPMAGQHGFHQRTEYSKKILALESDAAKINPKSGWNNYGSIKSGYILVSGSVPGPKKRLVMISMPRRNLKYEPVEIRNIIIK